MAYLQSTEHDSAPARLTRHLLVIKGTHMSLTSGPGSYRAQLAEELSRHRLAAHTSSMSLTLSLTRAYRIALRILDDLLWVYAQAVQ
eukprot:scaffold144747_cov21-Tisochrysis_lutea.AAC.1